MERLHLWNFPIYISYSCIEIYYDYFHDAHVWFDYGRTQLPIKY
jgi:hypothetical protein